MKNIEVITNNISSKSMDILEVKKSPHSLLNDGKERDIIFERVESFIKKNIIH